MKVSMVFKKKDGHYVLVGLFSKKIVRRYFEKHEYSFITEDGEKLTDVVELWRRGYVVLEDIVINEEFRNDDLTIETKVLEDYIKNNYHPSWIEQEVD